MKGLNNDDDDQEEGEEEFFKINSKIIYFESIKYNK